MKAIFTECSMNFWIHVAEALVEKNGWEICYWTGGKAFEKQVKEKFENIVFHIDNDAVRGIAPHEYKDVQLSPLDQKTIKEFSQCESIALKMMDRMGAIDAFLYHERINHYHNLLSYWITVLNNSRPDIVIFPKSPHMIYDYIMYEICKWKKIKTMMFVRTSIPALLLPVHKFEEGSESLLSVYREKNNKEEKISVNLSEAIEQQIKKLNGSYSKGIPFHVKFKNKTRSEKFYLARRTLSILRKGVPETYDKLGSRGVDHTIEKRSEYWVNICKAHVKRKTISNYYNKIAKDVDLRIPFIFVALQCQPERSTCPDGEVFVHQNLMVNLISKLVPEGWCVYVKEHISQFKIFQRAERSRYKAFYDEMLAKPNLRIVPLSMNSFNLIDNAKAVAAVSGSVGFESIIRGKPFMCFGHPWYKGCEGVFYTPDLYSVKEAISLIQSGYRVNFTRVRNFLSALEEVAIQGYVEPIYKEYVNIEPKDNAVAIYKAILEHSKSKQEQMNAS